MWYNGILQNPISLFHKALKNTKENKQLIKIENNQLIKIEKKL